MYARAVAATTTALLGTAALLLPASQARAGAERPTVIAHRGASTYAPENTLAAVDKAAELGIRWVENDVQRTKDGELVEWSATLRNVFVKDPNGFNLELVGAVDPR